MNHKMKVDHNYMIFQKSVSGYPLNFFDILGPFKT